MSTNLHELHPLFQVEERCLVDTKSDGGVEDAPVEAILLLIMNCHVAILLSLLMNRQFAEIGQAGAMVHHACKQK